MNVSDQRCGHGVLCLWMLVAVGHGKVFRWQTIENGKSGEERRVLVVKVPQASLREVVACPACGGRPMAGVSR